MIKCLPGTFSKFAGNNKSIEDNQNKFGGCEGGKLYDFWFSFEIQILQMIIGSGICSWLAEYQISEINLKN